MMVFNIIMAGIFLVGITLVFILKAIYKKMYELVNAAGALSRNQWWIEDLKETQYKELNKVAMAFNNMKHCIYENIEEIKRKSQIEIKLHKEQLENEKKDKMLKQAQLNTLQMQINPHFLFNTLNIIGKSAVLENTEQSLELIEDISRILRYSLENQEKLVLLEEEIDVIEAYLSIQRIRLQSRIQFDLNIDIDSRNIYIPPMIIQPLIENAIKHGLADTKEKGYVQISFSANEEFIYITVKDNGKGFAKDKLVIQEKHNSIGLYNVSRRLELQYKRTGVMLIDSVESEYSIITLKIPLNAEIKEDIPEVV